MGGWYEHESITLLELKAKNTYTYIYTHTHTQTGIKLHLRTECKVSLIYTLIYENFGIRKYGLDLSALRCKTTEETSHSLWEFEGGFLKVRSTPHCRCDWQKAE